MEAKKSSAIFLLIILFFSCYGQNKTDFPDQNASEPNPVSDLQSLANAGFDPNFVESRDTISKYGPRCITRDLLQDKNGNYWFATWQGIIKYDGKLFTNYTLKENLIHFHVSSCYEDKKGNLWFGTARGGVYRYDGKIFKLFTTKDGLVDNNIACIFEDNAGNMWFGTEYGASRYDGKTFSNFKNQDAPNKYVNSIMQDKNGKLWIGASNGIYIFNGKSFTEFKNKEGKSFTRNWSVLEDKSGNIWIGRMDGLTLYDGKSFTDLLTNFLTYYIIEDKAGNVYLTHSETNTHYSDWPNQILYRYDRKTFVKIAEKYEKNDFQIFGKIVDKSGNIWFGTMQGPCRYNTQLKSFTYFSNPNE